MGAYLRAVHTAATRTVVTFHDAGTTAAAEHAARAAWREKPLWYADALLWRRYERRLVRSIDAAVAFTARDAAVLRVRHGAPVTVVPLGIAPQPDWSTASSAGPSSLLFVGDFNHPPNEDAARWLLDELVPALRTRHPRLMVHLIGAHPPAWLRARAGNGVEVPGYVDDLAPYVSAATVVVAPLRRGGGMRVKVLEALAGGKAVLGTSRAFEGTGVVNEQHALVADDASSFVDGADRLLRDEELRRTLGSAARAHVAAHLTWDHAARRYESVYERLVS